MKKILQAKNVAGAIFLSLLLTACGGGDSGGGSTNPSKPDIKPPVVIPPTNTVKPVPAEPETPKEEEVIPPSVNNDSKLVEIASIGYKNHEAAGLAATNFISLERQKCGISGLSYDPKLAAISTQHGQYIQHVFSNVNLVNFNPHEQAEYVGYESVTGKGNPYFTGFYFNDRMTASKYALPPYLASENIVRSRSFSSIGMAHDPETAALSMARGLMSAPYHMRLLTNVDRTKAGTSLITYSPSGSSKATDIGYVLVDTAASESNVPLNKPSGILTYPCGSTTGTATALYNESPDPTLGTGRDLRKDPIGQPIHILVASAKKIQVSNVKIIDVARKTSVPITMIETDNDPHKGTSYEIPKNEAFILPMTDGIKSCEPGRAVSNNCGLHGNSEYQVSFDVLIDGRTQQSNQFIFKTGNVNY